MGALDDDVQMDAVQEWNLPVDRDGFLEWLHDSGVDYETFKTFPAYLNMPETLRRSVESNDLTRGSS